MIKTTANPFINNTLSILHSGLRIAFIHSFFGKVCSFYLGPCGIYMRMI